MLSILRKSRQDVRDCWVELDAERAEVDPKVFTRIHFHFVVTGRGLKADAVERAIKLSAEILLGVDHAGQDRRDHPRF